MKIQQPSVCYSRTYTSWTGVTSGSDWLYQEGWGFSNKIGPRRSSTFNLINVTNCSLLDLIILI